jgi:hypothetical protein
MAAPHLPHHESHAKHFCSKSQSGADRRFLYTFGASTIESFAKHKDMPDVNSIAGRHSMTSSCVKSQKRRMLDSDVHRWTVWKETGLSKGDLAC